MEVDLNLNVGGVSVEYSSHNRKVEVDLIDVDVDEIISEVGVDVLLSSVDVDDLVDFVHKNNIDVFENTD